MSEFPGEWKCGPVQIHGIRFVWWYRLWLFIKFRIFRRPIGFYYGRYNAIAPVSPCDYPPMVIDVNPKFMKRRPR